MMYPILSIIVPSYNTAVFLKNYPSYYVIPELKGKIEVLLIDDGSQDGKTLPLLQKLEEEYPDYFKCFHKENGGHGSVINFGIKVAKGKYFKVIDGDDRPNPECFIKFVSDLENCDDDLVLSDYINVYLKSNRKKYLSSWNQKGKFYNLPVNKLIEFSTDFHTTTYKTEIWVKNNICVREHCFYEDTEYAVFGWPYIHSFAYLSLPLYLYSLEVDGQSVSAANYSKHLSDHEHISKDLVLFYEKSLVKSDAGYISKLKEFVSGLCGKNYCRIICANISRREKINKIKNFDVFLKNHALDIYNEVNQRKLFKLMRFCHFLFLGYCIRHLRKTAME